MPISFTSFVYRTNVYWSIIHGIKRKPHLSVVWNWYHFVAIAILHQPRPTDSADINTRLQLSDTSSIPLMHGGFLLIPCIDRWLETLQTIHQHLWAASLLTLSALRCTHCGIPIDGLVQDWDIQCIGALWPSDAIWRHTSGSTLAQVMAWCLKGTKPLPEPMLTYHQPCLVKLIWVQFHRYLSHQSLKLAWKWRIWNLI